MNRPNTNCVLRKPALCACRSLKAALCQDTALSRAKPDRWHGRVRSIVMLAAIFTAAILLRTAAFAQENTNQLVQAQTRSAQVDYSAFRIVTERNIFAARRSGRVTRGATPRQQRQTETVALVGTLEAGNGPVAFFDGSSAEYRKAAKIGDKIAGFAVAEINFKSVLLKNEQQTIELQVGTQMRLQDDGQWQPASSTAFAAQSSSDMTARGGGADAGSGQSSSSDTVNEVLKRLMQQREQELQ